MMMALPRAKSSEEATYQTERVNALLQSIEPVQELVYLSESIKNLQSRYGSWKIQWGEINRYQRPKNGVFDDQKPSVPVAQVA